MVKIIPEADILLFHLNIFLILSSPKFSQEVSLPDTNQAQPCLTSVGNQSWL